MKNEILKTCMSKGFLLDREMLNLLLDLDDQSAKAFIEVLGNLNTSERVITKSLVYQNVERIKKVAGKPVLERLFINLGYSRQEIEQKEVEQVSEDVEEGRFKLLSSPALPPKKVEVSDFVKHFRARYDTIKKILEGKGLENLTSIRRMSKGNYTIIAMVSSKRITKNKNIFLEVEDMTGEAKVLVNQNRPELFNQAKDLLVDDIVAFEISCNGKELVFANNIIFPDAGLIKKKKHKKEELVAFTSDFHVGSKMFLEEPLMRFIKWLNGEEGDSNQKEIAKKVKYLFVVGDGVDGVGIFPGQDKLLTIKDIKEQYKKLAEILKLIRRDIKIIYCPGQHDAVRVAEPQPIIGEEWAPDLYDIENLELVPNPALVEIDGGFKVLMYHGAGFHGMVDEIEDIRLNYGHDSPARMVREVLKRRHLAPMHGTTNTYIPGEKEDPLVIKHVPDIVATGDWHRSDVGMYNNILTIAGSCWQSITPFEEKVGNHPDPCKVPIFNLKTREIKIMDFSDEHSYKTLEEKEAEK
ncbi:MAG: metallophosphoesterase [Candidatus Nanoarchaeia archaeon]